MIKKYLLPTINTLTVVFFCLGWLAPYFEPKDSLGITLAGLLFPAIWLGIIIILFVNIVCRSKWKYLFMVLFLIGIFPMLKVAKLPFASSNATGLSLTSHNINFLKTMEEGEFSSVTSFYKKADIGDVFCLQEFGSRPEKVINDLRRFDYSYVVEGLSLAIFSRYPIKQKGMIDLQSTTANTCLWVDIQLRNKLLRVYNLHLESNRHDGVVPDVIREDAPESVNPIKMGGLLRHYQGFSQKRVEQAKIILKHVEECPYPYVICGDFNDTPQSFLYQLFAKQGMESFKVAGKGLGFTYDGGIPFLKLDNIFISRTLIAKSHRLVDSPFSDHHLLTAGLGFN